MAHIYTFLSCFMIWVVFPSAFGSEHSVQTQLKHSVPAFFVFGDSTVDPGNNNYIGTIFKSDFPPYGIDLPSHLPTGRFCNGKLPTDFLASYLGIKEIVPPYLDSSLSIEELKTGVSFASAGSGFDPLTAQPSDVIPMDKQLEYFKEYKARMEQVMGKEKMEIHISKSIFTISAGTNDFVISYFILPTRRIQYSVTEYQNYLLENTRQFIQGLLDLGVRKIGVVGVPPMGCLPIVRTLYFKNVTLENGCIESFTQTAIDYNQKLQKELYSIESKNSAKYKVQIVYYDAYGALLGIIQNYIQMGFEEWSRGCCGTGLLELGFLCNAKSYVCPDRSKFVFWDSIHPTEKTYYLLSLAFRGNIDALI